MTSTPRQPAPESPAPPADALPIATPSETEATDAELIDNIVPTRGYEMSTMVGLGASAGGIQALIAFFDAMPADTGMVFVVVMHLSPAHDSALAPLLGGHTSMNVVEAEDGTKVVPNHVYVIPPGKYLTSMNGHLRLVDIGGERGKRVAIDMFFRSLADTHGPHAVAVVLSGVDGDGTLGMKRVKERGGLTVVQDPSEAEHPDMPRSAVDTGMVDWVLKADEIPGRLVEYMKRESALRLPPEDLVRTTLPPRAAAEEHESAFSDILVFLRTRTGRDFSCYKRATILRRIARRMQVNGVDDLPHYMGYLRTHPGEAGALLQDLLISVTNFFRDREAFEALEKQIPALFTGKGPSDSLRVWVPACATGEEAYSLAMLLLEHASTLDSFPSLQVFGCDLNEEAIQAARMGLYGTTIEADVSEARLKRFFVREHGGYRVRREIREMVLFATHDLLKDAPFSRMDLVSCRNLLIYLDRDAQQRALDTFHFAMKEGGLLFVGSSEAVDETSPLFRVVDKKHPIYAPKPAVRAGIPVPLGPGTLVRALHASTQAPHVVHGKRFVDEAAVPFRGTFGRDLDRAALADLHFKLLERYAPPSVLVNAEHDIVHLSEHAGAFLTFVGGEPTANLMRVVNPALRVELRAALFRAAESGSVAKTFGVPAEIHGESRVVDMTVSSSRELGPGFLLVLFEDREAGSTRPAPVESSPPTTADAVARHMERELEQVKERLRDTVEQSESSTEELKASNEELQAMNEELRSATEELETSREELQSINEELTTVNQEMKGKVDELANANSDLQNLMASTSIATVFLDRELKIKRFTPNAARIFNMIPGDVGRPLAHLKHRLDYPKLLEDAQDVLRTLIPVEREVTDGAQWYLARLQPYRTPEDHIAGAVLTLVDVTDRNRATEALRLSEERMRLVIESATDWAIFTLDLDRRISAWNSGAEMLFGYREAEIVGQPGDVLFTPEDQTNGRPEQELRIARDQGRAESERWHVRKDGSTFFGSGSVMPLRDKNDGLRGFVTIMRDLTETKHSQEAQRAHVEELTRFNVAAVGRETRMIELKREINELCAKAGEPPRYIVVADDERNPAP